jgi:hypothetical protein
MPCFSIGIAGSGADTCVAALALSGKSNAENNKIAGILRLNRERAVMGIVLVSGLFTLS